MGDMQTCTVPQFTGISSLSGIIDGVGVDDR